MQHKSFGRPRNLDRTIDREDRRCPKGLRRPHTPTIPPEAALPSGEKPAGSAGSGSGRAIRQTHGPGSRRVEQPQGLPSNCTAASAVSPLLKDGSSCRPGRRRRHDRGVAPARGRRRGGIAVARLSGERSRLQMRDLSQSTISDNARSRTIRIARSRTIPMPQRRPWVSCLRSSTESRER